MANQYCKNHFKKVKIPLPLPEQQQIAAILSAWDKVSSSGRRRSSRRRRSGGRGMQRLLRGGCR
ncbi:MAG: restriction endonuclease subunit S [Lewinellaceae bacterium]|nr:restriction endonuclease subunit S [Lewinellaceae bacterium]